MFDGWEWNKVKTNYHKINTLIVWVPFIFSGCVCWWGEVEPGRKGYCWILCLASRVRAYVSVLISLWWWQKNKKSCIISSPFYSKEGFGIKSSWITAVTVAVASWCKTDGSINSLPSSSFPPMNAVTGQNQNPGIFFCHVHLVLRHICGHLWFYILLLFGKESVDIGISSLCRLRFGFAF